MNPTAFSHRRNSVGAVTRRGFTLLEILLVIAIIGVLAGAVAFTIGDSQGQANIDLTRAQVNDTVPGAIERYKLNTKQLPGDLSSLVSNPGINGWAGPYLKNDQLNDRWGNPLVYRPAGSTYQLYSFGANQADDGGGGDDIVRE